jgi:hypothetical protein
MLTKKRRTETQIGAMDDDNIDNEENQQVQETEQERIVAATAAARRRRLRLISVLEGCDEFPFRTRNKTNELVDIFLEEFGDDIHDHLCITDAEDYRGLDSDRDTEEEVEAIVRFFPEALTRRKEALYPIQLLAFVRDEDGGWQCNVKAVSFIPLLARLAIELDLFEVDERGGLLCPTEGDNVLHDLMLSDQTIINSRDEQYKATDDKYLQVLIQMRKMGYLWKGDIQMNDLLNRLCQSNYHNFAEKRFRFLVEWDPIKLTQTDEDGWLPIHHTVKYHSTIQGFQFVFEYGIRYLPKKKGITLLFRKTNNDSTPFVKACMKFGEEQVMKIIEDTYIRCYSSADDTPPLNVVEALMTAAIDDYVHLDCVYFLLRRQPYILQKLLYHQHQLRR